MARARVDKQAVLQTAVEILDTEGIPALTLSRLAEKLGIQTPSLYNHIDGLPALQRELTVLNARLLADTLSEAGIGRSGPEFFTAAAQAFRDYVKAHPGLYLSTLRSTAGEPMQDPDLVREEERTWKVGLALMTSLGLQDNDAIHGLRAFRSVVHGFATLELAGGFGLPQDCDESFQRLTTALLAGLMKKA